MAGWNYREQVTRKIGYTRGVKHRLLAIFLLILPLSQGILFAQTTTSSQEIKNVNGTADTTVNATLPPAPPTFKLSGPVTGTTAFFAVVTARTTDGLSSYGGSVDPVTANYLVKVPAGSYKLSVSYIDSLSGATSFSTYYDPAVVQVTADTIHALIVIPATTHAVSGAISALDARLPSTLLLFVSSDTNAISSGTPVQINTDGTYSTPLPDGGYSALLLLSTKDSSKVTVVNLGSVTVAGADVVANFTVPPLASLSGIVTKADKSPFPKGSTVIGFDSNLALAGNARAFPVLSYGLGAVDSISGSYQLLLAAARQYALGVSLDVFPEDLPQTSGSFIFVLPNTLPLPADATQDIAVPSLPATVTISGQVKDSTGAPVANVTVDANTAEVTGISGTVVFSRSTQSDSAGNYRLTVLSGTNYDFLFTPPIVGNSFPFQSTGSASRETNWTTRLQSFRPALNR